MYTSKRPFLFNGRYFIILVQLIIGSLLYTGPASAQEDPVARSRRLAATEDSSRQKLPDTRILPSGPLWSVARKAPVHFRPITARDFNRDVIDPEKMLQLDNGVTMKARDFFSQLNRIEREANKHGYSLRDNSTFSSVTVTPATALSQKSASIPDPSPLLTEAQTRNLRSPEIQSENKVIKPLGSYSAEEKEKIMNAVLKNLSGEKLVRKGAAVPAPVFRQSVASETALKTINETTTKDYSFGSSSTFRAGVSVSLNRQAKIYGSSSRKTEFKITGSGKAYGSILGHSFTIMNSSATAYVPADSSKEMTLKLVLNIAGIDILNTTYRHAANKILEGERNKPFEIRKTVSFPLIYGINLNASVGVKGNAGLRYTAELDRTFLRAQIKPVINISGFLEAGLSAPLDIASIGVRSDLDFIKGYADLSAWFALYNTNHLQIVFGYGYDAGYCFEFLAGTLKLTWRIGCWAGHCLLDGGHTFFNWAGRRICGTLADGRFVYVIYSGPRQSPSDLQISTINQLRSL